MNTVNSGQVTGSNSAVGGIKKVQPKKKMPTNQPVQQPVAPTKN